VIILSGFQCIWFYEECNTRTQIISIDQILAQSMKARGRTIRYDIHKLINSIWNKEELPEERKESVIVLTFSKVDEIVVIFEAYKTPPNIFLYSIRRQNYWGHRGGVSSSYQVKYWSYTFYSSNTGGKMGIQWVSALGIYTFQDSPLFI
jgi:hypothetical protein